MYVFDVFIYNPGRPKRDIIYSPESWQLMLTGHQSSFGTKHSLPSWSSAIELELGDAWIKALRSLDDATLESELGDVLDKRRLAALAGRRDDLLERKK
jgi:hypothetical protein